MAGRWGSERQKANGASASTGLLHTVIEASLSAGKRHCSQILLCCFHFCYAFKLICQGVLFPSVGDYLENCEPSMIRT